MVVPVTRYAKSGDVHIAYQVFGSGATDLVFVPGFISHIENYWEHPDLARWLLRLGAFARVIMLMLSRSISSVNHTTQRHDSIPALCPPTTGRWASGLHRNTNAPRPRPTASRNTCRPE